MKHTNWKLSIHVDDGRATARLHQEGKMDTITSVSEEQMPWFIALINLIEGRGELNASIRG